MNIAEMYLRKHPGENAAFDSAPASLHGYMGKKLDFRFADDCRSVYMRYAGTIAMEVYMRGVMDRARPHYAVVSREQGASVSAGRAVKQRCAACMPFDRMAQAEWESEHESPHCLSH